MKKILAYAGENKRYIYGAGLVLLLSTICGIVPFFLLNKIIVALLAEQFVWGEAVSMILGIGLCLLLKDLFYGAGLGLSHLGAYKTLYNIRIAFSKKMAAHSMGHIMSEGTGKYKKAFVEDLSNLEILFAHMLPEGIPYICGTIFTLVLVFITDWRIGCALLITIPMGMAPMGLMMKENMPRIKQYYKEKEVLNNTLIEYVSGMEAIKVFNKTDKSFGQLHDSVIRTRDINVEFSDSSAKYMGIMYSLLPCTLLLSLPLGVYLFTQGKMEVASLTLVIMFALSLSGNFLKIINFMPTATQLGIMLDKVEKVFMQEDVASGDFDEQIEDCSVTFCDVSFAYEEKEVLKHINLQIPSNSICAIVGESGSGKSTIAKLLMHFWDIDKGNIQIGGKALSEFTFENLMNHLSYVSQENTLFDGTVYENIAVAKEGIRKEEVVEACKKANCHDFIERLEQGYDTNVGLLGNKLSGGERQRITIARAMIKNAPIVVLDEATAFADAENESLIQDALSKLLVGKTVLIIAHKLYTIVNANQIVVLKDGEIEMCATHEVLLQQSPTYEKLWKISQESVDWDLGGELHV